MIESKHMFRLFLHRNDIYHIFKMTKSMYNKINYEEQ